MFTRRCGLAPAPNLRTLSTPLRSNTEPRPNRLKDTPARSTGSRAVFVRSLATVSGGLSAATHAADFHVAAVPACVGVPFGVVRCEGNIQ